MTISLENICNDIKKAIEAKIREEIEETIEAKLRKEIDKTINEIVHSEIIKGMRALQVSQWLEPLSNRINIQFSYEPSEQTGGGL